MRAILATLLMITGCSGSAPEQTDQSGTDLTRDQLGPVYVQKVILCCPTPKLLGTYWASPCGGDGGLLRGAGVGDWSCVHGNTLTACSECAVGDTCGLGGILGMPSQVTECQ